MKTYVAVICRKENFGTEVQHPVALTSTDKDRLIQKALIKRAEMQNGTPYTYSIFLGEMTSEIVTLQNFKEIKI